MVYETLDIAVTIGGPVVMFLSALGFSKRSSRPPRPPANPSTRLQNSQRFPRARDQQPPQAMEHLPVQPNNESVMLAVVVDSQSPDLHTNEARRNAGVEAGMAAEAEVEAEGGGRGRRGGGGGGRAL